MAFASAADIIEAELSGKTIYSSFRKNTSAVTDAATWFDMSMSSGFPVAQYYAATPLTATVLSQSNNGGFYHGGNVSPLKKYVRNFRIQVPISGGVPAPWIMLDYLMFYSFIEDGTLDEQVMINTNTLTRYTDGEGVQIMAVNLGARTGGQSFTVKYTNQDGTTGKVSKVVDQTTSQPIGTIVTSSGTGSSLNRFGPFIPLADGDTGVRKIESLTMQGEDTGIFALVLVVPIFSTYVCELGYAAEMDFYTDKTQMPVIQDDAYLNLITNPRNTITNANIIGDMLCVFE